MTKHIKIEEGLYARQGKRVTSYFTQAGGAYVPLGNSLDKARAALYELRGTVERDDTIAAMCKGFIQEQVSLLREADNNALAPRTIAEYRDCLERHIIPVVGAMRAGDFKPMHAAQYLARRRKGNPDEGIKGAPVGANREIAALASAFNYGMREGLVESNPCHGVKRNKERPRQRKVGVAEFNGFMQFAREQPPSLYMAALIGAAVAISGRRRAELLPLTVECITAEGIRCTDAKIKPGEAERFYMVKWSPLLVQILTEVARVRPGRTRCLFPTRDGEAYTDQGFKCNWNKLIRLYEKRIGERFRAHDLRAMYVTEMIEQDRDPNTHKNVATMMRVYDRRRTIEVTPLA